MPSIYDNGYFVQKLLCGQTDKHNQPIMLPAALKWSLSIIKLQELDNRQADVMRPLFSDHSAALTSTGYY